MLPAVRTLYKELLVAARGYPEGMSSARSKLRNAFLAQARIDVTDVETLSRCLRRGEHVLAELHALTRLHKYR